MSMITTHALAPAGGERTIFASICFHSFASETVEALEALCEQLEEAGEDHHSLAPLNAMLGFQALGARLAEIATHALTRGDAALQQMLMDIGVLVVSTDDAGAGRG